MKKNFVKECCLQTAPKTPRSNLNYFIRKLVGVQKAQISKLENSANSATIDTVLKVFKALKADIHFNVTLEKQYLQLVWQ